MVYDMAPQWRCVQCDVDNRYNRKSCRVCAADKPPHEVAKSLACAARKRKQLRLQRRQMLSSVREGIEDSTSLDTTSDDAEFDNEDNTEEVEYDSVEETHEEHEDDGEDGEIEEQVGLELLPQGLLEIDRSGGDTGDTCVWCGTKQPRNVLSFWCIRCQLIELN